MNFEVDKAWRYIIQKVLLVRLSYCLCGRFEKADMFSESCKITLKMNFSTSVQAFAILRLKIDEMAYIIDYSSVESCFIKLLHTMLGQGISIILPQNTADMNCPSILRTFEFIQRKCFMMSRNFVT